MLKISISFPGETVITVESSESDLLREIIYMALKELPKEIIQHNAQIHQHYATRNNDLADNVPYKEPTRIKKPEDTYPEEEGPSLKVNTANHDSTGAYVQFCESQSPLGDMRKVVVAAEGASRFLGMESISENELGELFKIAGWREPTNYLQCLRNAARSKFRWLERIPGKPGYYYVTPLGNAQVLAQQ